MATARGKQYVRAANLVERQPSNIAPSSPPPSPKNVRFAPSASSSRELTSTEAWSIYHFETHALSCRTCADPFRVYLNHGQLCDTGHALAQDVALHVYYKAGDIYSKGDKHKLVRVELPPRYDQVRSLLKGMDHQIRSRPTISYDRSYPVPPRPTPAQREPEHSEGRNEVVIEPADSRRHRSSGRKSKHKPKRYQTTVVQDEERDVEPSLSRQPSKPRERRGSLYHSDQQRKVKEYHVEERVPEWERSKKDERRRSGVYA